MHLNFAFFLVGQRLAGLIVLALQYSPVGIFELTNETF